MWIGIASLLLIGCEDRTTSPLEAPEQPGRQLQQAFDGETGVSILVNGSPVNNQSLAADFTS